MTAPRHIGERRIESVYFALTGKAGLDDRYPRMAAVLAHSAEQNAPDFATTVRAIESPISAEGAFVSGRNGLATNSDKLEAWNDIVQSAPTGDYIALLDADMMVMGDLGPAFELDFDVAYTIKPEPRKAKQLPFNGGTVLVKVSDASRAFFAQWTQTNRELYADVNRHAPYRAKYGGMNQASLGCMLDEGLVPDGCHLEPLPCQRWNACDMHNWRSWRSAAIVHVKGALRTTVFSKRWRRGRGVILPRGTHARRMAEKAQVIYQLATMWHQFEREAKRAARTQAQATG